MFMVTGLPSSTSRVCCSSSSMAACPAPLAACSTGNAPGYDLAPPCTPCERCAPHYTAAPPSRTQACGHHAQARSPSHPAAPLAVPTVQGDGDGEPHVLGVCWVIRVGGISVFRKQKRLDEQKLWAGLHQQPLC